MAIVAARQDKKTPRLIDGELISFDVRGLIAPLAAATAVWTPAATVAAATPVSKATTAPRALFARASQADFEFALAHAIAIEHADGLLRFDLIAHLYEAEALGLAGITVLDQCY